MTCETANTINQILDSAAAEGRSSLLEHEVYGVLNAAGCRTPAYLFVKKGERPEPRALAALGGGAHVMVKVVSPEIAHKTEVGGVKKVANEPAAIAQTIEAMLAEVPARQARVFEAHAGHGPKAYEGLAGGALESAIARDIRGFIVVERIAFEGEGPGSETIVALRHNREFGPVLTMGVGGVDTELLGEACKKGEAVVSASAALPAERLLAAFRSTLAHRRLTGRTRTAQKLVDESAILATLSSFQRLATCFGRDGEGEGWTITELEVNPFGACKGELVALDGLLKFRKRAPLPLARPLSSLDAMLQPKSAAIIGVSSKGENMGRIILNNLIQSGFDSKRLYIVREGCEEIAGIKCVPSIRALPERVDLFILAVSAEQVPGVVEELVEHDKAVGVILIPGGLGEKEGGEALEGRLRAALHKARTTNMELVAVGGNSLGIVSKPGRYNTIFIPQSKLPLNNKGRSNVALLSQSGAFMISRLSKMAWLSPRYAVSAGNQTDLTITDFLRHTAKDPEVRTFAVYIEGFKDGDGLEFSRAVEEIVKGGRDVIFYKAGRTAEGKQATSGHTASLAGDYDVCEAIVRGAGAYVARNFEEFKSLMLISSLLGDKSWSGRRLAAISNAGYETVGMSDSLRGDGWNLSLAPFTAETRAALKGALVKYKLDGLVDVRNPLDVTPMANDEANAEAVRAFLADPTVDAVLFATIPLTAALGTLAHELAAPGAIINRLKELVQSAAKPVVVSIDSGELFDPMAKACEEAGIPTFRSADEACKALGLYIEGRLARG